MSNNDHSFDSSTISDEAPIIDSNLNTDPKNASFTIDDIINYGGEYEKSLPRQSADIVDKYFHIFSSRESEKLANAISPYKTQRVSWMTLYDKIIRKIINPFNVNGNKSYVTLQEIENRMKSDSDLSYMKPSYVFDNCIYHVHINEGDINDFT